MFLTQTKRHGSAVCTQNIAKIRSASNLIRSFAPRLPRNAAMLVEFGAQLPVLGAT